MDAEEKRPGPIDREYSLNAWVVRMEGQRRGAMREKRQWGVLRSEMERVSSFLVMVGVVCAVHCLTQTRLMQAPGGGGGRMEQSAIDWIEIRSVSVGQWRQCGVSQ